MEFTPTASLLLVIASVLCTLGHTEKCHFQYKQPKPVPLKLSSGKTCEETCYMDQACTHFTYVPFPFGTVVNCYIYKSNISWSDRRPSTTSNCGIKDNWKKIDEDYSADNCLFQNQHYCSYPAESPEECFYMCQGHTRCTHFNFLGKDYSRFRHPGPECRLMSGFHSGKQGPTYLGQQPHQQVHCGFMNEKKTQTAKLYEECPLECPTPAMEQLMYYIACYFGGFFSTPIMFIIVYITCKIFKCTKDIGSTSNKNDKVSIEL